MKPEDLTVKDLEEELDLPTKEWHGKCSLPAHAAVGLLDGAQFIYGHYLGPIATDGYWGKRLGFPNHHGWVLLEDDRVLDPTRWSFENKKPYIYIGENDGDYDEGGDFIREKMVQPCPKAQGNKVNLNISEPERVIIEKLVGMDISEVGSFQLHWLANLPYKSLDWAVGPVYDILIRHNLRAFIPIDNLRRASREGRISKDQAAY